MRVAGIAALCAVLACVAPARAADAADHAFVEVTAPRDTYYVGEPIRLRLRAGYDAAWFAEHAVPLFRSPLDVPVQVDAPSLAGLPEPGDVVADASRSRSFALNGERASGLSSGEEVRHGRTLTVITTERVLAPERAGEVVLAAPALRFAFTTGYDENALSSPVPVDRKDARVEGGALRIKVLALPDADRPQAFTGAVGRFTVTAGLDTTVTADAHMRLSLHVEGQGSPYPPPPLALDGFHVYGVIDHDASTGTRTFTYDIAPLRADVAAVPAIEFAYFDTTPPAQYRVARTAPIPFTPRPGQTTPAAPPPPEDRGFPVLPALAILGAALLVVLVLAKSRRAKPDDVDPAVARVHAAAAAFRLRAREDLPDAFTRFVAACLDCAPAAVVSPDLVARMAAAGVPADLARRAAALLERLVSARYGGASDAAADEAEAASVVSAWEAASAASSGE